MLEGGARSWPRTRIDHTKNRSRVRCDLMASAAGSEPTPSSQRMVTSLDLGRRKWAKLSQQGRALLSSIVNARSQLDYVGSSANWAGLSDCAAVRARVEASLLETRRDRSSELEVVLDELQAVVLAMRAAVDDHRARVGKEAARRPDPSTAPLIAHAEAAVGTFERELALRRELALEMTRPPARLCAVPASCCGRHHGNSWRASAPRMIRLRPALGSATASHSHLHPARLAGVSPTRARGYTCRRGYWNPSPAKASLSWSSWLGRPGEDQ